MAKQDGQVRQVSFISPWLRWDKSCANAADQKKSFESDLVQQQKQIEALAAGLQKVSAQLELEKAAPQTVLNDN